MGRRLMPFRQGTLDGLCGPYSVVNAIRFAMYTLRHKASSLVRQELDEHDAELLFGRLIEQLVRRRSDSRIVVDGVNQAQMSILLRVADEWLRENRSMRLSFKRPLKHPRAHKRAVLREIASHLGEPGTAAIIAGSDPWLHWSVATKVTPACLILFDSGGDRYIFIDRGPRKRTFHAGLVHPPDLHLVTLTADSRSLSARSATPAKSKR